MSKVKNMSVNDLEHFIEQKLLEIIGDPDSGLELQDEFKKKIEQRLTKSSKRVTHEEVVKKFG